MKILRLIFSAISIVLVTLIAINAKSMSTLSLFTLYVFIGIYMNGRVISIIHMSKEKMECISSGERFDWSNCSVGYMNFLPFGMEIQYIRNMKYLSNEIISEYEGSEYNVPLLFKITRIINKVPVVFIATLMLIVSVVFQFTLNDYDLYFGVGRESLITTLISFATVWLLTYIGINNYAAFKIVNFSLGDRLAKKTGSGLMILFLIFSVYALLMNILIFVFGILGIELKFFTTILNLNIVGVYTLFAPIISIIQTFVVKGSLSLYQHVLNESLN